MRHFRKIALAFTIVILAGSLGAYLFFGYWTHRYDDLIERQAAVYGLDDAVVWSVIYEETYFRAWIVGADAEIGLMQVTPAVANEWARETGLKEFEKQTAENLRSFLSDPERNIQVGCWYLERLRANYRNLPAERPMMLSAYNAGPGRVDEWTKGVRRESLSEDEFIGMILIPSTRAYVSSIMSRIRDIENRRRR